MQRIYSQVVSNTNTGAASSNATGGYTLTGGTPIPLNYNNTVVGIGFAVEIVSGAPNYTVYHTYDETNTQSPLYSYTPIWFQHAASNMVAATTTQESNFVIPISAMQVIINSGTGSVRPVILQQGSTP